ncbi:MAG TPA: hypothetical protein VGO78_25315 [Acidimicrobiales bacterium]|nr:hypothetical protein [Acidimicrobiales bacterium]
MGRVHLLRLLRLDRITGLAAVLVLAVVVAPGSGASARAPGPASAAAGRGADVVLLGDSVTEQAFGYLGGPTAGAPAHLHRWSRTGWTLRNAADHAGAALSSSRTGTLVIALGPNDAAPWDHGWNHDDVTRWRRVLAGAAPATCVAVVLPGWGAPLRGTVWEHDLRRMRSAVDGLVAARRATGSPTVELDWLPVTGRHPGYLAPDGIHLATTAAATARQSLYWQAVGRCAATPTPATPADGTA